MKYEQFGTDLFNRYRYELKPVTVGIAALCDVDDDRYYPRIVFCADRLVSAGIQYEGGESKIKKITDYCYSLQSSNDSLTSDMIVENVKKQIKQKEKPSTIEEIAEMVRQECINIKNHRIEREVLSKYNLTISNLKANPDTLVSQAMEEVKNYRYPFGTEFVILGLDITSEARIEGHIYTVDQDGIMRLCDTSGFATTGSGSGLAYLEMTKYEYSRRASMAAAIPRVYLAKKVSERAEGVGRNTDLYLLYIGLDGQNKNSVPRVHIFSDTDLIPMLDKLQKSIQKYEEKKLMNLINYIQNLIEPKKKPNGKTK